MNTEDERLTRQMKRKYQNGNNLKEFSAILHENSGDDILELEVSRNNHLC